RLPRHLPQQVRRGGAVGGRRVLPAGHGNRAQGLRRQGDAGLSGQAVESAMSKGDSRVEEFRRVTGATMRAISRAPELNAVFAPGQHGVSGADARLPMPSRELPREEVAQLRGEADSIALKLRHHDAKT